MKQEPPSWLLIPIAHDQSKQSMIEPQHYITPVIDGQFSSINIEGFTVTIEEDGSNYEVSKQYSDTYIKIASDEIIEISIDKNITKRDLFHVRFDFNNQIVPLNGGIEIDKNTDFADNWFI